MAMTNSLNMMLDLTCQYFCLSIFVFVSISDSLEFLFCIKAFPVCGLRWQWPEKNVCGKSLNKMNNSYLKIWKNILLKPSGLLSFLWFHPSITLICVFVIHNYFQAIQFHFWKLMSLKFIYFFPLSPICLHIGFHCLHSSTLFL